MALIWLDGELRDADSARVSIFDHGLTVGDGVFETLKTQGGRAFALSRHLDRLAVSAAGLGAATPVGTANTVVAQGATLQYAPTANLAFAAEPIPARRKIGEIRGESVSVKVARQRARS